MVRFCFFVFLSCFYVGPVGFDSCFVSLFVFFRGLSAPEAEMLYMQEVEKMEGYGQESYQAKVRFHGPAQRPSTLF